MRHRREVCYGGKDYYVEWDGFVDRVDPLAPSLTVRFLGSQLSPGHNMGGLSISPRPSVESPDLARKAYQPRSSVSSFDPFVFSPLGRK